MVLFVLPVHLTGSSLPDMIQWKYDFKIQRPVPDVPSFAVEL